MGLYEPALKAVIAAAFERLYENLQAAGPMIAARVGAWMDVMGGVAIQQEGYKHPLSYPMLLLPWWAEKSLRDPPDVSHQTSLAHSTICGYYAIRLIDNLMDGHATLELELLPALQFFLAEFQSVYHNAFARDDDFWGFFSETWYHSAEVTLRDAATGEIDREHFVHTTSRKTEAVKIPIAAVCHDCSRPELSGIWTKFVDLFGCWHQMSNDLFDWRTDLELGTCTYFLSEAERCSTPEEPVVAWVAREGFDWAIEELDGWMADLREQARALGSPDLLAYLNMRDQMLRDKQAELAPGLDAADRLFDILAKARGTEQKKSE